MNDEVKQSLIILTRAYYDYQKERIRLDNQMGLKKDGNIKKGIPDRDDYLLIFLNARKDEIVKMEIGLAKDVAKEVHKHVLWNEFLKEVCGCGEQMAAVIITQFDIHKANTVSNMWSFAGLAPGKDKKKKGEKCTYNQFLKSKLVGVLGSSFLKSKSPYSDFYYNMKNRYESENWGVESKNPVDKNRPKAGHQHNAAIRYMVKMFLKDLYVAWRTLEGLPVREPYQEEYLEKKHE